MVTDTAHYEHKDMKHLMQRARDIADIARQLCIEDKDLSMDQCIAVVGIAFRDWDAEHLAEWLNEVSKSIDECQKDIRYLVNSRGVK